MVAMIDSMSGSEGYALPSVQAVPAEAAMVMTAMEAGRPQRFDRRERSRWPYRVTARLRLFSDAENTAPWTLYTRDASRRALGFLTPHRLPLGYGGMMELAGPDGQPLQLHCTLLRCRQAAPGWYEGCVYFNRDQPVFDL